MGQTTITLSEGTKAQLAEHKPESVSWDVFMRDLVAERHASEYDSDVVRLSEDQYNRLVRDVADETRNQYEKVLEDTLSDMRGY